MRTHSGQRAGPSHRSRRGLSLVETALVLPVLLLVTFGAMEYGGLFWRLQQIDDVTRQAARQAALAYSTQSDVTSTVSSLMTSYGLGNTGYTLSFSTDPGAADTGTLITVTVSVPYDTLSLTHFSLLPVPTNLVRQVTMSKEGW